MTAFGSRGSVTAPGAGQDFTACGRSSLAKAPKKPPCLLQLAALGLGGWDWRGAGRSLSFIPHVCDLMGDGVRLIAAYLSHGASRIMKASVCLPLIGVLAAFCFADNEQPPKAAQSITELQRQLEKILKDKHLPGISVAIVKRDGPEWVAGLGLADVASGSPATADTQFRIGSTSKAFASLSILKLANEGKLSLLDPVRKLVPEVWFENHWEATDPVLVVDLLEHTTGWDDLHLREYAKEAPATMGLREGLDYDHHSRVSRWPPGTRMAYCNSGPAVAAYIVEKIAGRRFEDYVVENFFQPIGMKSASYFQTAAPFATSYHDDGKTPYPYWNILLRPAGSINASANDMAAYLAFYLNRGTLNGVEVMPAASIERMENPTRTWAAQEGLKAGYGLSNYWTVNDGFVYHGHNGGVLGGLTELAYMPDFGAGYFFSINTSNGEAFERISKTIRAYITRQLSKPPLPPTISLPANAETYAGWYEPDSPRVQMFYFFERLVGQARVHFSDGKMFVSPLVGTKTVYLPTEGAQLRGLPEKEAPSPVATAELLYPRAEGQFIQIGTGQVTMKRIPGWQAILQIVLTAYVLVAMALVLLYAPFWLLGGISRKRRRPQERAVRWWPLMALLSLLAMVLAVIVSNPEAITRFGNLTMWSGGIFVLTILFALTSVGSAVAVLRAQGVRKWVWRCSAGVALGLLIATAYLAYWGIIGLRLWA
jgi:CubicO group peptidase (beta-lactamase class C family)